MMDALYRSLNHIKPAANYLDHTNYRSYKKALSEYEVNTLRKLESAQQVKGTAGGKVDLDYRNQDIQWLPVEPNNGWLYLHYGKMFLDANNAMWHFDIHSMTEDFQYGVYRAPKSADEQPGRYNMHLDIGKVATRKISMVTLLSDPSEYEGGEFMLQVGSYPFEIKMEKGEAIFFPSYLLHGVRPVTKGERRSLVMWATGPAFT